VLEEDEFKVGSMYMVCHYTGSFKTKHVVVQRKRPENAKKSAFTETPLQGIKAHGTATRDPGKKVEQGIAFELWY